MLLAAAITLAGPTRSPLADDPLIRFNGGGFVFNYRMAVAHWTIILKPERPFTRGSTIEVAFENPAGSAPIVVRQTYLGGSKAIVIQSEPLQGIRKAVPYEVTVRLIDPATGSAFATLARTYTSDLDQSMLPEKPQFIGPGYHRNPELDVSDGKVILIPVPAPQ
jgi:hypothetical protein